MLYVRAELDSLTRSRGKYRQLIEGLKDWVVDNAVRLYSLDVDVTERLYMAVAYAELLTDTPYPPPSVRDRVELAVAYMYYVTNKYLSPRSVE